MSPRTTDVPGQDMHALPAAAAVRAPFDDAYTGSSGISIQPGHERGEPEIYSSRTTSANSARPLSSGFKSLAWTKPAADNLRSAPVTITQRNKVYRRFASQGSAPSSEVIVRPVTFSSSPCSSSASTKEQHQRQRGGSASSVRPILKMRRRSSREAYLEGVQEDGCTNFSSEGHQHQYSHSYETTPSSSIFHSAPPQQQTTFLAEPHEQQHDVQQQLRQQQSASSSEALPSARKREGGGVRSTTIPELDAAQRVWDRVLPRREYDTLDSSLPDTRLYLAEDSDVRVERSLSDSSIVTASDFGTPKINPPTILHEMSDQDAMQGLLALCSKGKGLQVVKHAGYGGGKSRKYVKYVQAENMLVFSGVLPPYLKTKIPIADIGRVEAKWCSVVLHAEGRPAPLLLEVDSISTASVVKAGLMVAARNAGDQHAREQQHSPEKTPAPKPSHKRIDSLGSDMGLAVVRPGHRASAVYDPDAALTVAALLAKEMEEERAALSGPSLRLSASYNGSVRPTFAERQESAAAAAANGGNDGDGDPVQTPIIARSFSTSSIASTTLPPANPTGLRTDRMSLPQPANTTHSDNLMPAVNAAAALRRLHNATGGRGLMAIKRKAKGKGRSRVLVRSRMQAGTVGWVHVLPPFSRKNIPFKNLLGATRSVRVVTLKFRHREPVMLETDRLTDAIILEQGFTCLASLAKTPS